MHPNLEMCILIVSVSFTFSLSFSLSLSFGKCAGSLAPYDYPRDLNFMCANRSPLKPKLRHSALFTSSHQHPPILAPSQGVVFCRYVRIWGTGVLCNVCCEEQFTVRVESGARVGRLSVDSICFPTVPCHCSSDWFSTMFRHQVWTRLGHHPLKKPGSSQSISV